MADFVVECPSCKKSHAFSGALSFREECACGQELHACVTCRFYDRYAENECREPTADPVKDKTRRNLCEEWSPKDPHASSTTEAERAKEKLNALFKGATPASSPNDAAPSGSLSVDDAKARLEALFRKKS
jgi:hypothetical protein